MESPSFAGSRWPACRSFVGSASATISRPQTSSILPSRLHRLSERYDNEDYVTLLNYYYYSNNNSIGACDDYDEHKSGKNIIENGEPIKSMFSFYDTLQSSILVSVRITLE